MKNLSRALTLHDESCVRFVELTMRMRDDKYRRCESTHSDKQDAGRRKSKRKCRCEDCGVEEDDGLRLVEFNCGIEGQCEAARSLLAFGSSECRVNLASN